MRILYAAIILLCVTATAAAQSGGPGTYRFKETLKFTGSDLVHKAELVIRTKNFAPSAHKITYVNAAGRAEPGGRADSAVEKIDGRMPLGVAGELPRQEIVSVVINFDGALVTVPSSFYFDCFNPNFDGDHFGTALSDNGKSLLVFMAGGAEKNLYQIIWIFRKDGQHARFVKNCPTCEFNSVLKFFKKD